LRGGRGGACKDPSGKEVGGVARVSVRCRPVTTSHIPRTRADLQRMARETLLGRECQVRKRVPPTRTRRLVVIIWKGRRVRTIQRGVTRRIRIRRVVRAGLVVADVAVLCVDRKSVSSSRGSRSTLHLEVKTFSVSTISSSVF